MSKNWKQFIRRSLSVWKQMQGVNFKKRWSLRVTGMLNDGIFLCWKFICTLIVLIVLIYYFNERFLAHPQMSGSHLTVNWSTENVFFSVQKIFKCGGWSRVAVFSIEKWRNLVLLCSSCRTLKDNFNLAVSTTRNRSETDSIKRLWKTGPESVGW